MLLGDLIERLSDPAIAAEMLLSLEPLALGMRVDEQAQREQLTAGEYAARAIDRFVAAAGDEEWLTLIGHMSHPGPATSCCSTLCSPPLGPIRPTPCMPDNSDRDEGSDRGVAPDYRAATLASNNDSGRSNAASALGASWPWSRSEQLKPWSAE
jgi:hypothetical protein